ncbi:hypothetical protein ACIGNX_22340 [Actinosynnema sp. NPDC053489]|uniref:hypothetical protein n=1 Tax=Actinosynnema sp. NPDC053489 TaxID=3363916 RepID=UPI0037C8868A
MVFSATVPLVAPVVRSHRAAVRAVLDRLDDRLLVVVGPGLVQDAAAVPDYAAQLAEAAARHAGQLLVVLDAQPDTADGGSAQGFALDVLRAGLPVAARTGSPGGAPALAAYAFADLRSADVGAEPRLAAPVGYETRAGGDVVAAVEALRQHAARRALLDRADGDRCAHLVLRTEPHHPDHDPAATGAALARLGAAGLPRRLLVAVSGHDPGRQRRVAASVARQVGDGRRGIVGAVVPSFLHAGHQRTAARRGVATAGPCLGLPDTVSVLDALAVAVERRRLRDR